MRRLVRKLWKAKIILNYFCFPALWDVCGKLESDLNNFNKEKKKIILNILKNYLLHIKKQRKAQI